MQIPRKTLTLGALGIFALVVIASVRSGSKSPESDEISSARVLKVETVPVELADTYRVRRVFTGSIKARRSADLTFSRSGTIETILAESGEEVDKDEVLATFDLADLEEQKKDLEDEVKSLKRKNAITSASKLQTQVDDLDSNIESGKLLAPFDGVVSMKHVSEGAAVSPSVPVLRLIQKNDPEAWFSIPADIAAHLEEDEMHTVQIKGRAFEAQIANILPEIDSRTRTRTVIFSFDLDSSLGFLPGDTVELELEREVASRGIWLPLTALSREIRGLWSVFLVEEDEETGEERVSRRYLEVVHLEEERARIRGSLADGDLVISDGTLRVVPGQVVTTRDLPNLTTDSVPPTDHPEPQTEDSGLPPDNSAPPQTDEPEPETDTETE